MNVPETLSRPLSRLAWWAFSVPIYIKILGIGFLVTILFGVVAFYQIRTGMYQTRYQVHGETALAVALSLASRIEPLVQAQDRKAMDEQLNQTMRTFPDVRYIVLQGPDKQILSHGFTFPSESPPDLLTRDADLCATCHPALLARELPSYLLEVPSRMELPKGKVRVYTREGGLIFEVTVPIGDGSVASVRLGVGDNVLVREIDAMTRSLLWSLALCTVVGLSLALALAYILVRPILNLVQATHRIREGDFSARADVLSGDEIGSLALSFNQMAKALEDYRQEVQENEAGRLSLLARIVHAQEEERKSVARELHDQLGQSLSNTLLTVESSCDKCGGRAPRCGKLKDEIRGMIDQVRQLAWQTRPSILDDYGLNHALARYAEEISERAGFAVDYQCVGSEDLGRLPDRIEVALYRIVQEAMTNVTRHAEATQVSVILMRQDHEVSLLVEDNGRGFEVSLVENRLDPPLGLMGMKERAALVGGVFSVYSHAGEGTTVRVRIPVNEERHGDSDSDSG